MPYQLTQQKVSVAVSPDTYGAVGDGVTDDTNALLAAFNAGYNIALTPGKTYLHRRTLQMNTNGTTLYGNGATLKRAAQATSTTTTTITANVTTSITLASAANIQVNDQIVIEQGGTYDTTDQWRRLQDYRRDL